MEDASIRLGSVAADVLGVSGRAMLGALLDGERDPGVLAELARGRLRNKLPKLREALRGRFSAHHALLVRLALEHVEQLERSIAELDAAVDRVIALSPRPVTASTPSPGSASGPPNASSPRSAST
jgi:transposase